ncbi:MAG: hypothetical protein HeimC2_23910 [Candidatus Heimdallarchaeota archaeon LC_2]|nr:MAG: hypothetical protein HeimC2_23910 [Candidatus Heimdallarchaeota archaeon LC_2]
MILENSTKTDAPSNFFKKKITQSFSETKYILLIIALLHLLGLLLCMIDFYYLKWYIVNYNEGLIPDQQMFQTRGNSVLSGNLPYEGLASWESLAPPLSMYALAVPLIFEDIIPIPLAFTYRIYFSIFNLLTCWLMIKIGEKSFPQKKIFLATILYGMGPYMVMQAALAGSDECMGAFLMMLVIYLIVYNKPLLTVIFIGLGTSIKYYPSLLIPYFLATRKTLRSQMKYGLLSSLSVIFFFVPFYFVNPENFMLQFNNRIEDVPWNSPGNSGIIMLIVKLQIIDLFNFETYYRIVWISSLGILSAFQIIKKKSSIEDAAIVPTVFFILYPKFFFSYFAIILPFYCFGFVSRRYPWILWSLMHVGLLFAGMMNDRVLGYSSVYRQEEGKVPLLLSLGITLFYSIWIFIWLLIVLKRDLVWENNQLKFPLLKSI